MNARHYTESVDFDPKSKKFFIHDPYCLFKHLSPDWSFSAADGKWTTPRLDHAHAVWKRTNEASPKALVALNRYFIIESPVDAEAFDWPAGKKPFDYQIRAAVFSLSRPRSYLAIDPGLGKTAIASLCRNHSPGRTLVICPGFLKKNWVRELLEWDTNGLRPEDIFLVEESRRIYEKPKDFPVVIVSDSLVRLPAIRKYIEDQKFDWLFVDEAHRYTSETSQRTLAVFGGYVETPKGVKYVRGVEKVCSQVVCLSGTIMPNRPIEMWPVLFSQAPGEIDFFSKYDYGVRYCDAKPVFGGFDYRGASNEDELREKVFGRYALRIQAEDVAAELPNKRREMVLLDGSFTTEIKRFSRESLKMNLGDILDKMSVEHELIKDHKRPSWTKGENAILGMFATMRKELGLLKIPFVIPVLKDRLEYSSEKIVVFAYHRQVVDILADNLKQFGALKIHGDIDPKTRVGLCDQFRDDPSKRVIVLNINSGGVGLNGLQIADRVIFAEWSWVPGENVQCEDRVRRLGSDHGLVFSEYLVAPGTFDEIILSTLFKKMEVIQTVTNKKENDDAKDDR